MQWDHERLSRLQASLHPVRRRAWELAARHAEVDVVHLAAALLEQRGVQDALRALELDLDEVSGVVLGTLDEQRKKPWWRFGAADESAALEDVYTHLLQGTYFAELDSVRPTAAFIALLAHASSTLVVERLEAIGVEPLPLRLYDAHGLARDEPLPEGTGSVRVVLHDDPYTPMELVVEILVDCFELDPTSAHDTMMTVHRRGRTTLPFARWSEGKRRAENARARAREQHYPLRLTLER
jgi:ATP-dependent Clp protease adaptor protein ClpS